MHSSSKTPDWREDRRQSARDAIVDAAWTLAGAEGLAGWSLRDLARRAGITTPTVYAYFDSKHAIYDAMFGQAATRFADTMSEPFDDGDPRELLAASVRRFTEFCTHDTARYQLLFQRTLPDFEPSAESYAPAVRALDHIRESLARVGITDERHVDLWTALTIGLVDQQISNDPGGDRWTRLVDEAMDMFLAYSAPPPASRTPKSRSARSKGTRP